MADVALVWDRPSMRATDAPPKPSGLHRYADEVLAWYSGLHRAGVTTDIVAAGADLSGYSAVVVPSLHVAVSPVVPGLPAGVEAVLRRHGDAGGDSPATSAGSKPAGTEYLVVIDHAGRGADIAMSGVDLVTGTSSSGGSLRVAPGAVAVVRRT